MVATKSQKLKQPIRTMPAPEPAVVPAATPAPAPAFPPAAFPPPETATNGKKKKKKKGKGKATPDIDIEHPASPVLPPPTLATDLDAAPAAMMPLEHATAQDELLKTANELYRRMDADPGGLGVGGGGLAADEEYWASLPAHIQTFVRNAYGQMEAGAAGAGAGNGMKAQAMYAIAQQ
ncbi:hypothetical protein EVG20_g11431, partial [Dentipellis fragilis]